MDISLYAGLLSMLFLYLTFNVSLHRFKNSVSMGGYDDLILFRKVRAQGNFVETVSVGLILIALAELSDLGSFYTHVAGGSLLLGRICHALSMLYFEPRELASIKGLPIVRILGMMLTLFTILFVAIFLLVTAV